MDMPVLKLTQISGPQTSTVRIRGQIPPSITALLAAQKQYTPSILAELTEHDAKIGHWIWWIFPTSLVGRHDRYKTGIASNTDAELLLHRQRPSVLKAWLDILKRMRRVAVLDSLSPDDVGRIEACSNEWRQFRLRGLTPLMRNIATRLRNFYSVLSKRRRTATLR